MKRFPSRFVIGIVVFIAVFFLTACAGAQSPITATSRGGSAAQQPSPTPQAPIAARVNDQTIPLDTLARELTRRLEGMKAAGEPEPPDMNAFRAAVLEGLIEQVLIEQAAAIQGVKVTDSDVEAEFQANVSLAGDLEKLRAQITADRLTEDEYRLRLRSALITQKMRDVVTQNVCVAVEQVRARHILVTDEATATQIKTQLDGGADFATLAAQFSLDVTTKQIGGDLGWFARGQLLQKPVEDVAFELAINAISGPVKSELGYHIIQTLERAKDRQLAPEVCSELSQQTFERWIQDLKGKATIERYPNGQ